MNDIFQHGLKRIVFRQKKVNKKANEFVYLRVTQSESITEPRLF